MSARDRLFDDIWDQRSAAEKNALLDAHRDEVALEIGRDALRDGLLPTLTRLVGDVNAAKLVTPLRRPGSGQEPLIHSGITDVLDDEHPLAHETVYCDGAACRGRAEMLHHCINENMTTWVETRKGNYCLPCFTALDDADGVDRWSGA